MVLLVVIFKISFGILVKNKNNTFKIDDKQKDMNIITQIQGNTSRQKWGIVSNKIQFCSKKRDL